MTRLPLVPEKWLKPSAIDFDQPTAALKTY
jgi:hypothetical protein